MTTRPWKTDLDGFLRTVRINHFKTIPLEGIPPTLGLVLIGGGASGEVFAVEDFFALKKSDYSGSVQSWLGKQLREMMDEGDHIYRTPNTISNKTNILLPNYLSEALVAYFLDTLEKCAPSFPYMDYFYYDKPNHATYMKFEILEPIKKYVKDTNHLYYFIFQILFSLDVAQKCGRFVHFDLHQGNIMIKIRPEEEHIYPLNNGNYLYTNMRWDAAIIDYGYCRFETENFVVIPRQHWEAVDYFGFNPRYDVLTFLYTQLEYLGSLGFDYEIKELLMFYLKVNTDSKLETKLRELGMFEQYFRPDLDVTGNFETLPNLISFVASKLNLVDSQKDIEYHVKKNIPVVSRKLINIPGSKTYGCQCQMSIDFKDFRLSNSDVHKNFISIEHMEPKVKPEPLDRTSHNSGLQYAHVAKINQQLAGQEGFSIRFDCCRYTLLDFIQSPNIEQGIAINGGPFYSGINGSYEPIGVFKNSAAVSRMVPFEYKDNYRNLVVDADGRLKIVSLDDTNYPQVLSSAPALLNNYNVLLTGIMLEEETEVGRTLKWQCSNFISSVGGKTLKKCDENEPGEFHNASNRSSRSAIGTDPVGNVFFVYVEGREKRGDGMSLRQLTDFCLSLGISNAVSLDSGVTSNLVWKFDGYVYYSNPEAFNHVPLGTIISYVKMQ